MNDAKRKVGLALSGGGTKGIAHAGVLKFLEEQHLTIDEMAGTSAGAIVACMYASGKTPDEILNFFKSVYFFSLKHFTLKRGGMLNSIAFRNYFHEVFGDTTIGDLKIKTKITATDLVNGRLKIFDDETRIVDAILASTSVPGVVTPHVINGKIYSDGGILNHFPVDLLLEKCDILIGVYVSSLQTVEPNNLNSLKAVTSRAFNLLSANGDYQKFKLCNWLIQPHELAAFNTFETNKVKMEAIFTIGYEAAKSSFAELSVMDKIRLQEQ